MNNKNTIIIAFIVLALIIGTGYKAVFGESSSTPSREELKADRIKELQISNDNITIHNSKVELICSEESLKKQTAIEKAEHNLACLKKETRQLISIDEVIQKEFPTTSS